jgi:hypothetical protein
MPWEQSAPMDQKTQFVSEYLRGAILFTELCDRYGISRKTCAYRKSNPTFRRLHLQHLPQILLTHF